MRLVGQIFMSLGIFCAALVAAMLILQATNDCTMNWYGYDCPEHYRILAATGPFAFVVAPVSLVLGGILMWSGGGR